MMLRQAPLPLTHAQTRSSRGPSTGNPAQNLIDYSAIRVVQTVVLQAADWTPGKIRERARTIDSDKGPTGDFDD